jgi:enterochelin esterase-like enzyme
MGLTSGAFEFVMLAIGVAGIAGVVWIWPRLAGRRIYHLAARLLLLVVSEVLVIAAFLVVLNSYFSFYGSWSQLLGSGSTPVIGTVSSGGQNAPLLTISRAEPGPLPGGQVQTLPSLPAVAAGLHGLDLVGLNRGSGSRGLAQTGELLEINLTGPYTGISVSGDFVYLPPQYFQPAYAHARFPAVLVLTGYPGSAWSIVKRLLVPSESAALVAAKKATPAVYVMMNASVAMPRDTECTNIPAGPQVLTFFTRDVPTVIERMFRVAAGGASWGALGYSTGGFCAVKMAMMAPGQFSLAVSLAGYYQALVDHTTGNLYGGSLGYRDENSPDWRLQHLPAPPVSVLVASSVLGERSYRPTLAFLRLVRPPMRAYSLFLPQGGHNFTTWDRELPQSLEWLSARLRPALS